VPETTHANKMKNLTYEEIIEELRKIAEGDADNAPDHLGITLSWLTSEAKLLPEFKDPLVVGS